MAALTELYSQVMRQRPELHGDRAVALFIQESIEIMRRRPTPPSERPAFAPVDLNDR